ncbi:hypothetical protein VNO77_33867 [Canavalia gladiata]|uniref:Helicase ATP-binding domain-containing protein n=1 Tax=Canavalia gladiata TaxID=3824 RepID=A0AAN9KDB2_CANGL
MPLSVYGILASKFLRDRIGVLLLKLLESSRGLLVIFPKIEKIIDFWGFFRAADYGDQRFCSNEVCSCSTISLREEPAIRVPVETSRTNSIDLIQASHRDPYSLCMLDAELNGTISEKIDWQSTDEFWEKGQGQGQDLFLQTLAFMKIQNLMDIFSLTKLVSRGVDVVVGTLGRIIDFINGNNLKLIEVKYLVVDEADQTLAVGFQEKVEVILEKLLSQRQSMLFFATMPGWVKKLAKKYLDNPLTIDLVGDEEEKLAERIKLHAIAASATSKTLNGFWQGKFTVLVATDVAAHGLDIPNVDLIIYYELPNDPKTFFTSLWSYWDPSLNLLVHQLWKRFLGYPLRKLLPHLVNFIPSFNESEYQDVARNNAAGVRTKVYGGTEFILLNQEGAAHDLGCLDPEFEPGLRPFPLNASILSANQN